MICKECGMPVDDSVTYHPYAACLMFKACQSSDVVQANLDAVIFHGIEIGEASATPKDGADNRANGTRRTDGSGNAARDYGSDCRGAS